METHLEDWDSDRLVTQSFCVTLADERRLEIMRRKSYLDTYIRLINILNSRKGLPCSWR